MDGVDGQGQDRVSRAEVTLREIHEITTTRELAVPDQYQRVLELGCRQFGLPFGTLSRVEGDFLVIEHVVCPNNEMQQSMALQLCETFCSEVVNSGEPLGISDVDDSAWRDHPGSKALGLKAYLGAPIRVRGKPWGTLCFFDFKALDRPLATGDFDALQLMAQWVQASLETEAIGQQLRAVMEGTAATTGADFFRSMVRHAAEALDVRFTLATEYVDQELTRARSLAFWAGDDFADDFEFDVAETPCAAPAPGEIRYYASGVQRHFPGSSNLVALGADGFVSVPVCDSQQQTLGCLIATDNRPIQLDTHKEWILKIFAARAGAELARLRAESASREGERRYALATSAAHVALWELDLATGDLNVEQNIKDLLGLADEEVPSTVGDWMERVHPDDAAEVNRLAWEHIRGLTAELVSEHRMLHRDGTTRWVLVRGSAIRDDTGRASRLAGTRTDITERKRLEEILRNVAEGVSATTGDAFLASIVEYLAAEFDVCCAFVGRVSDIEDGVAVILSMWVDGAIVSDAPYRVEGTPCEVVLADGRAHFERGVAGRFKLPEALEDRGIESYLAIALHDQQRRPIGVLGIMDRHPLDHAEFPETVLKIFAARAAAELRRMDAEREQRSLEQQIQHAEKLKSLGVLAGGIAHDFNNLLTGILGNTSLAAQKLPEDSDARVHLERIENATKRAENLTKQMLAYSGRGNFVIAPLDLNELVGEISDLLTTVISKNARLERHFTEELPAIEADATQVRQVIMNLIMNASDALEDSPGRIWLRTGRVEITEDGVGETALNREVSPGNHVFVEVRDSGSGMNEETQRRMFDPFFSTKFAGRGLGMSAVLGIVQGHQGSIIVDSTPGEGTTIRVLFPQSSKQIPKETRDVERGALEVAERSVLIVDDEEMVREVIRSILEATGVPVITACDGEQAIDCLEKNPSGIALVLLDLTMPGIDGSATLERMHAIDPSVPVVLMSGYDEKDATLRFGEGGLAGFLQKPFDADLLLNKIEQILLDRPSDPPDS